MSGEKAASPCNKFQANIFNKSKCQNCFKPRELHLLNDLDMEQAKPIYGGWLCLAPVGTDFDNPMQRSRKWQRRFFILYEHGSLSFALDELPSTLPQGTVNMNLCTDIADAEPRTGQRNAVCIITPEQEIFIRGDNKEIINGWSEQLAVYLRTNKQNQKKKRKVEPVATQEPSPAKMAATDPSFPSSQNPAESGCGRWQEDQQGRGPGVWTPTDTDPPSPEQTPAGDSSAYLCPVSRDALAPDGGLVSPVGSLDLVANGNGDNKETTSGNDANQSWDKSPTERPLGSQAAEEEEGGETAASRTGRSEARSNKREKLQSCGDIVQLAAPPPQRRARSLDRRTTDTVMTPDLLNFKKGWMVKLDETQQWKKYWFVLSTDSLRFYKDSIAEEASDLEGEIDLTKCFNVSEYQVQRNYGFQIHTPKGVHTLSAMTSGIRKNWIQALMKNVHPANAPDVASLPGLHGPCSPPDALPKPDVTQDSPSADAPADPHPKHRTVMERRREGRYRTFDWAEFRPQKKRSADADAQTTKALCSLELGDLERRRRREERRRKYESMLGISLGREANRGETGDGGTRALKSQQEVEEEVEECWKLVEQTVFRLDRTAPLFTEDRLLDGYRKAVEDLKAQLVESERRRLELETQQQQPDAPLTSDLNDQRLNSPAAQTLTDTYEEARELLRQQNVLRQNMQKQLGLSAPSIWLHDAEGNLQELRDLLPEAAATPPLSPASDSHDFFSQRDGETNPQQVLSSEAQINTYSLMLETPAEELNRCMEHHAPPDQAMVRQLSQEVELLTSQKEALNQRNQEMLNQLTEADREIERLKAELSSRYSEPRHLPEVEQQTRAGDLETELSLRQQQLLEAQTLITSLEENLRETEALLQLQTGRDDYKREEEEEEEGGLLRCLEAKLTELERQLSQSEATCRELQTQNEELKEAEVRRLNEELDKERATDGESDRCVSAEERIQEVMEAMGVRLNALGKLLEAIDMSDVGLRTESEEDTPAVASQLKWEEEFWSSLLSKLKSSQMNGEKPGEELLREVTERMIVERQMLLLGHSLLPETNEGLKDQKKTIDFNQLCDVEQLRVVTEMKTSFLNRLASSVSVSRLQLCADSLSRCTEHPWSGFIHSAATEALYCCHLSRLRSKYDRELQNAKLLASSNVCRNCIDLMEENTKLRAKLSNLEDHLDQNVNVQAEETQQQDAGGEARREDRSPVGETGDGETGDRMEIPEEETREKSNASLSETRPSFEEEQVSALRRRVTELEEQLAAVEEEFNGKMSAVQTQHEKAMEKLKVTCERGFASMEESHMKFVEELQRRHQQEVERLLVEKDRLLEEESAATATAIEAIENAHRLELEREVQRRCESERSTGNGHLEDVYRQHREELTSFQRELQVLSRQFSLKCLENGHLVQALDAERRALCQCQQENRDLRSRNQELSAHLAAEITRLCSLAKQDELPLSQGMDVYELEITLRVKESEVGSLKQEVASLKDELQAAQRDKRNATKKYKDALTELNITRVKSERETDELRENLRLAHRALDQTSF